LTPHGVAQPGSANEWQTRTNEDGDWVKLCFERNGRPRFDLFWHLNATYIAQDIGKQEEHQEDLFTYYKTKRHLSKVLFSVEFGEQCAMINNERK
jgi:hypothetical protein